MYNFFKVDVYIINNTNKFIEYKFKSHIVIVFKIYFTVS